MIGGDFGCLPGKQDENAYEIFATTARNVRISKLQ